MSLLQTIEGDVAKLAPLALSVVSSIEKTLKGSKGADKKSVAVQLITDITQVLGVSGNVTAEGIGQLVDTLVGILNATGLFSHSTPAA